MNLTPCPNCPAQVLAAILTKTGQPITLQPRPYARGSLAVRLSDDGRLLARYALPGAVLSDRETRYSPHEPRCRKREDWQKAQSKSHAENRRRGQRYERKTPVVGVRKAAEGER